MQDNGELKNKENKFSDNCHENRSSRCILADIDPNSHENERNDVVVRKKTHFIRIPFSEKVQYRVNNFFMKVNKFFRLA